VRSIAKALIGAFRDLFPKGKHSWLLIGLVLIAAIIPVSELLITKLFTDLIMHADSFSTAQLVTQIVVFFGLFGVTRAAHYAQKVYKVKVFDKAFIAYDKERSKQKESWEWALAMELTTILSALTQLGIYAIFFTVLDPLFGIGNIIVVLAALHIIGVIFGRQLHQQNKFYWARKIKKDVAAATRVGSRVKSGEIGTLFASGGMVLLMAFLLVLSLNGLASPSNLIVLFLGARMQNSTLSQISSGLMRFARASANNH